MPAPSTSFSSLSSFTYVIYVDYIDYAVQLRHMFSFLASTPAVTDLELQMDDIGYIENVDQLELAEFICPSVTSFGFHLPLYIIGTLSTTSYPDVSEDISHPQPGTNVCVHRFSCRGVHGP